MRGKEQELDGNDEIPGQRKDGKTTELFGGGNGRGVREKWKSRVRKRGMDKEGKRKEIPRTRNAEEVGNVMNSVVMCRVSG